MAYIGNQADTAFTSLIKQDLTGASGTSLTLTHAVANANDIALYINNVRQEPVSAYSTNGTEVSLTGSVVSSDDIYVIYLARAVQTTVPPDGSVSTAKIASSAVDLTSKVTGVLPVANGGNGHTAIIAFHVSKDNDATMTPANPVIFNVETTNIGTHYSTSTGRFTAPVAGVYRFEASGHRQTTDTDSGRILIYKNGTTKLAEQYVLNNGGRPRCRVSVIIQLAASDYITIATADDDFWAGSTGEGINFQGNFLGAT